MSLILKLSAIVFIALVLIIVNYFVSKGKIAIKYSFVWTIPCLLLLLFIIVPGFLSLVTKLLGFQTASNMIFAVLIALLVFITIALTVIVSTQNNKIRLLIQELSMLKREKDEK